MRSRSLALMVFALTFTSLTLGCEGSSKDPKQPEVGQDWQAEVLMGGLLLEHRLEATRWLDGFAIASTWVQEGTTLLLQTGSTGSWAQAWSVPAYWSGVQLAKQDGRLLVYFASSDGGYVLAKISPSLTQPEIREYEDWTEVHDVVAEEANGRLVVALQRYEEPPDDCSPDFQEAMLGTGLWCPFYDVPGMAPQESLLAEMESDGLRSLGWGAEELPYSGTLAFLPNGDTLGVITAGDNTVGVVHGNEEKGWEDEVLAVDDLCEPTMVSDSIAIDADGVAWFSVIADCGSVEEPAAPLLGMIRARSVPMDGTYVEHRYAVFVVHGTPEAGWVSAELPWPATWGQMWLEFDENGTLHLTANLLFDQPTPEGWEAALSHLWLDSGIWQMEPIASLGHSCSCNAMVIDQNSVLHVWLYQALGGDRPKGPYQLVHAWRDQSGPYS